MQETIYEVLVYDNNFRNITTVSHLRLVQQKGKIFQNIEGERSQRHSEFSQISISISDLKRGKKDIQLFFSSFHLNLVT